MHADFCRLSIGFMFGLFHLSRNLNKLIIKLQSYPQLTKIDVFNKKYAYVTALLMHDREMSCYVIIYTPKQFLKGREIGEFRAIFMCAALQISFTFLLHFH